MKYFQLLKSCFPLLIAAGLSACGGAAPESGSSSASSAAAVVTSSSLNNSSSTASQTSSGAVADTQAPSAPAALMLGSATTNSVTISWNPATDNIAVTGYQVYRDNLVLSDVGAGTQTMIDSSVTSNKSYVYGIKARDAAGNWSPLKTLTVVTPSAVGVGGSSSSAIASSKASSIISSSKASSVVSSSKASSVIASSASSKSSSSSSSAQAVHSTTLGWIPPTQRENGDPLLLSEIGGYSIRYTSQTTGVVSTQNVSGGGSTVATVPNLVGAYAFEIATYDTNGLYSDYELIGIK